MGRGRLVCQYVSIGRAETLVLSASPLQQQKRLVTSHPLAPSPPSISQGLNASDVKYLVGNLSALSSAVTAEIGVKVMTGET